MPVCIVPPASWLAQELVRAISTVTSRFLHRRIIDGRRDLRERFDAGMAARQRQDSGPDRGHDRNPPAAFARYGTTSLLVIAHPMAEFSEESNAGLEMVKGTTRPRGF
jgi:hypothetical protein